MVINFSSNHSSLRLTSSILFHSTFSSMEQVEPIQTYKSILPEATTLQKSLSLRICNYFDNQGTRTLCFRILNHLTDEHSFHSFSSPAIIQNRLRFPSFSHLTVRFACLLCGRTLSTRSAKNSQTSMKQGIVSDAPNRSQHSEDLSRSISDKND